MVTAAKDTKTANGTVSAATIEEQIAQLRSDISTLGQTVADYGSAKVDEVGTRAKAKGADIATSSREALEELSSELVRLEKQMYGHVKRHPVRSLGIAAGIGFLAAMLIRR